MPDSSLSFLSTDQSIYIYNILNSDTRQRFIDKMKYFIYLLIFFLSNVSSDNSAKFCLCALKSILQDYALFQTNVIPPRYYSSTGNDIGFFVGSENWKPVNNATWKELGEMINAPNGMYTQISIDGISPVYDGLSLNSLRSSHLANILAKYRSMMTEVDIYHQKIIEDRTETCSAEAKKVVSGSEFQQWEKFFRARQN